MATKKKTAKKKSTKKRTLGRAKRTSITIDYIKSTAHRVIFVSGAHGGPTPTGRYIHMSLFNERTPIPKQDSHSLAADGKLGPLTERSIRSTIVREVETTAVFDLQCARALRKWLDEAIRVLESATGSQSKEPSK